MSGVQLYVVGFAFDRLGRVALIRKNRPAWQAGRLNGIGGHVEPAELPDAAMVREFEEETGTRLEGWELFSTMDFPGARIRFYRLHDLEPEVLDGLKSMTDEQVSVWWHQSMSALDASCELIPNLTWLVPLAWYRADRYEPVEVQARVAEVIKPIDHETVIYNNGALLAATAAAADQLEDRLSDFRTRVRGIAAYALRRREIWARRPGEVSAARAVAYQHMAGQLTALLDDTEERTVVDGTRQGKSHVASRGPVHNHPPHDPPCNERRLPDGSLRGACLPDTEETR